ncbi:MAG TPA: tRNA (N6-isopentenyl adenosine(37)-C2)-methylthiotransferase MiaB [Thermotogota bacterium]|nr:tRNA (N6-isopentenyl adenosine(37)-C2)-methylthiotransferase MiaB [Thermotogota bacterium]HPJ87577.1 tRNA (N6-isopentenyl adenosine(37)-C2)-methylthiotransferase MiaB [Thermotogota bacterium]HPR94782.1 tRNA (N6-isopentenyl adenosine(37)-C2)-methylthiotransferase MiaB [Thermotogota bacterium]
MKFYFETYGCQMNVNDSEIMKGILVRKGHEISELEEAEIIIVNTCAVRQKSEEKAYAFIGRLNKMKIEEGKKIKVGVCGCAAEKERKMLLRRQGVDFVFGTRAITRIEEHAIRAKKGERFLAFDDYIDEISYDTPIIRDSSHHAYVTIAYGCNKFCTYCIVPYTRGRELSRPFDDIIRECDELAGKGYKEITLLGQNVDSYGLDVDDEKVNFANLLREVSKIDGLQRIWFLTSYPSDFSDEVIEVLASSDKFAKNIHLPVQSGSNRILKAMNRRYTREDYLALVNRIKKGFPEVSLTSDIIIGFPGETEEDYLDTVNLVREVGFEKVNLAIYSEREGTVAYKNLPDDVPLELKKKRLNNLLDIQKNMNKVFNEIYQDKIVEVIAEAALPRKPHLLYGRTDRNKIVIFESDQSEIGEWKTIKINRVSAGPLYGEVI